MNANPCLRRALIGAAAIVAGAVALPAMAQPYDDDSTTASDLVVIAPHTLGRSTIGAPIRLVSTQRVVRYGDLDLGTAYGGHQLMVRIERAARRACDDLDQRYPITDENSPPCYENAVADAMDRAIDELGYVPAGW